MSSVITSCQRSSSVRPSPSSSSPLQLSQAPLPALEEDPTEEDDPPAELEAGRLEEPARLEDATTPEELDPPWNEDDPARLELPARLLLTVVLDDKSMLLPDPPVLEDDAPPPLELPAPPSHNPALQRCPAAHSASVPQDATQRFAVASQR
jgi:hypothetical protein